MAKRRAKRERSEQQHFEGTAPAKNGRVHSKAVAYVKARDERMILTREESDAQTALLEAMLEEGLETYEYGGMTVTVQNNRKCKVKMEGSESNGEE